MFFFLRKSRLLLHTLCIVPWSPHGSPCNRHEVNMKSGQRREQEQFSCRTLCCVPCSKKRERWAQRGVEVEGTRRGKPVWSSTAALLALTHTRARSSLLSQLLNQEKKNSTNTLEASRAARVCCALSSEGKFVIFQRKYFASVCVEQSTSLSR